MENLAFASSRQYAKESITMKAVKAFQDASKFKKMSKRHPKTCRWFNSGKKCKFKGECFYNHIRNIPDGEQNVFKEKVEVLKKTVSELTEKVEEKNMVQLEKVIEEQNVLIEKSRGPGEDSV